MFFLKDALMNSNAFRKILVSTVLFSLFMALYDVLLHSLLITLHITFEWIEFALEEIIEHTFHTNRKQSQLIVFYLLWLIGLYGIYRLTFFLYRAYNSLKKKLVDVRWHYQLHITQQWIELTLIQQLKWATSLLASFFMVVFFTLM
jgi:hypothetical protein